MFVTPSPPPSAGNLLDRRRALRRKRRSKTLSALWRLLAVAGMASSSLWLTSQPFWLLQNRDQVIFEGNQLLSDEVLRDLLPIAYPQPLLRIHPEQITHRLIKQSPITQASVTRQLFPPRLLVSVQERQPVAVTIASTVPPTTSLPQSQQHAPLPAQEQRGLIDSQGHWISMTGLGNVDSAFTLPKLRVRGFQLHYQTQWPSFYQTLQESGLDVEEIDWQDPTNLILHTRLGLAHLGPYNANTIQHQLSTLKQLRSLTDVGYASRVEYVDLRNPEQPAVKIRPPSPGD